MKILTFIVIALALMGCTTTTTTTNSALEEYRDGMESGAAASTALLGTVVCESLNPSLPACDKMQNAMLVTSVSAIRNLSDYEVTALMAKDKDYKAAMKQGSIIFSSSVGLPMCKALHLTTSACSDFRDDIEKTSFDFIDNLSPEVIERLKKDRPKA